MEINSNAVLKTVKEIEINAPIETVWEVHTHINEWKDWHPDISHSDLKGKLKAGSVFEWKSGGYKLRSQIKKVEENRMIGWHGTGFGATAIHLWEFSSLSNGNTLVRTKESMDGWLVKLLKGMMRKNLNDSLETWLAALKNQSESR
ncbi:SRPBCC family protein [Balneola sp. MJW-20]|uniref:SRPBCC family protein n=1 Tax=Gracilimonas aurantiaca TaxID=3234185 RepID=UPI0034665EF6